MKAFFVKTLMKSVCSLAHTPPLPGLEIESKKADKSIFDILWKKLRNFDIDSPPKK